MPRNQNRATTMAATLIVALCVFSHSESVHAQSSPSTIAPDGSCSINTLWEQGSRTTWYIELQRQGEDFVRQGIAQEDDRTIRYGLSAFDWGFAKQAADGSFTGTSDPFHSTSLFIESAAYTALLLQNYHPKTYTMSAADTAYYAHQIAKLVKGCNLACGWLTEPAVATTGQSKDVPYTSRRYILAALFAETDELTGSTTYDAVGASYALAGIALQLPNGVNPELGGYDVEYQEAGVLNAAHYYSAIAGSNPILAASIQSMMVSAMNWECGRINTAGAVDISGSTRVGIELGRDGTVKQMDTVELQRTLYQTWQIAGSQLCLVSYNRINLIAYVPSSADVASDGSCDYNTDWENGKRSAWNVQLQRAGVNWVEYGIEREDDSAIRTGLSTIDWAFKHQAPDGTFTASTTMYFSSAQFLEAAARAALDLQVYSPVTYVPDESYYSAEITKIIADCKLTGNWLILPSTASAGIQTIAGSSYSQYYLAAALQEIGILTNSTAMESAALTYANTGLALRVGGTSPELGKFDLNKQSLGDVQASYYYRNDSLASTQRSIKSLTIDQAIHNMLESTLATNSMYISKTGTMNYPSPDKYSITAAFLLGANATGDRTYMTFYNRIGNVSIQ